MQEAIVWKGGVAWHSPGCPQKAAGKLATTSRVKTELRDSAWASARTIRDDSRALGGQQRHKSGRSRGATGWRSYPRPSTELLACGRRCQPRAVPYTWQATWPSSSLGPLTLTPSPTPSFPTPSANPLALLRRRPRDRGTAGEHAAFAAEAQLAALAGKGERRGVHQVRALAPAGQRRPGRRDPPHSAGGPAPRGPRARWRRRRRRSVRPHGCCTGSTGTGCGRDRGRDRQATPAR